MPDTGNNASKPSLSFRRLVLRNLAFRIFKHPYLSLLFVLIVTSIAAWGARHLEVEANLRAFVPRLPAEKEAWDAIHRVQSPHSPVFALVEIPPPPGSVKALADEVVPILQHAWEDTEYIASAEYIEPALQAEPNHNPSGKEILPLLQMADIAVLRQMSSASGALAVLDEKLAKISDDTVELDPEDPFDFFETILRRQNASSLDSDIPPILQRSEPPSNGAARLLFSLHPAKEHGELAYSVDLRNYLTKTASTLQRYYPRDLGQASITYYGRHIETAALAVALRDDLVRSIIILVLCLILLMILAFRKIESVLFIGLPSCIGLVWTLGSVSLFLDSFSLLTAVFIVLLMIPGLEYAVQIYHRFTEELYRERDYYGALSTAYTEAGRGVVVCSLAIFLVFLSLYLSSFYNLQELALVGALGIFFITAGILIILPLMAALKSRLARAEVKPLELYEFGLKRLSATVISSPRMALALLLIITAYLAHHSSGITINRDIGLNLAGIPHKSSPYFAESRTVGANGRDLSILIESNSLQGALEKNDLLYANLLESSLSISPEEITSLSKLLPSIARQSKMREEILEMDISAVKKTLERALKLRHRPVHILKPFLERLRQIQTAARQDPMIRFSADLPDTVISSIQKHIVQDNDRYQILTTIHPQSQVTDNAIRAFDAFAAQAARGLGSSSIRYDSEAIQNRRVADAVIYSMAVAVMLAIASLFVCLLPHFRWRLEDVLLAILPMACAMIWTLGLLALLHYSIGLYTLLMFPLLVGISLSQSVLLIQRLRERHYASLRQVLRFGGRANIVSALALLITFGCLGQTGYDPLQETALVAGGAIAFSTAITLIFIPALLQIRQEGGLASWNSGEDD